MIRFERIAEQGGIQNGKLFYNIGNAYFRHGRSRPRDSQLPPRRPFLTGDANLTQNLRYARSRRIDQIEEKQETQVLKTLLFWHYDLSQQTRSAMFAGFFVGSGCWRRCGYSLPIGCRRLCWLFAAGVALLFLGLAGVESAVPEAMTVA